MYKVFGIRRSFSFVEGFCNPDFGTHISAPAGRQVYSLFDFPFDKIFTHVP